MKPDNKLQLNCHNEASQNAKETSNSFTLAPSVAEIVPLWSIFSLWVQLRFLLDAQLPYTARITTKNQTVFFLNAFG